MANPRLAAPPLQKHGGNDTDAENQRTPNASTGLEPDVLKHLREPERTDEAPDLAHKRDKHTDAGGFFLVAVDGVGDEDCSHDLIAHGGDGGADEGRHVPLVRQVRELAQEHDVADHAEDEARVAEPETVFGRGALAGGEFAGAALHPRVREDAAELFADEGADDDAGELVADLLGIEVEFFLEELGDFDRDEDRGEEEDHGVGCCSDHDGCVAAQC